MLLEPAEGWLCPLLAHIVIPTGLRKGMQVCAGCWNMPRGLLSLLPAHEILPLV